MGDRPKKFIVEVQSLEGKIAKGIINGKEFVSNVIMHHITPKWKHKVDGKPASPTESCTLSQYINKYDRTQMLESLNKDLGWS